MDNTQQEPVVSITMDTSTDIASPPSATTPVIPLIPTGGQNVDNSNAKTSPQWTGDSCSIEECVHKKAWRFDNNLPVHPGGRPCKFCQNKDEYMKKATEYLASCNKSADGKPRMPFVEELAIKMDTIDENIVNWANKKKEDGSPEHEEFLTIYSMVKMTQKFRLKQRALGRYNPAGALALLRFDHGAVETSKQIHAGDSKEPIEIKIIEEDREKYQE